MNEALPQPIPQSLSVTRATIMVAFFIAFALITSGESKPVIGGGFMAKKKSKKQAKARTFAASATGKTREQLVQEVYDDELKEAVRTYIQNTVDKPVVEGVPIVPEEVFLRSLKRIKDTQEKVLQMIQQEV
jgi:hypothetical protein